MTTREQERIERLSVAVYVSLLRVVGHPLGRSFLSFAKRYCAAEKNDYGWETRGASNIEELTVQLHGVMLRRSKDDVLSLPPKIRTWLPVDALHVSKGDCRSMISGSQRSDRSRLASQMNGAAIS